MTEIIVIVLAAVGVAFSLSGAVGILRMPDVYSRIQCSSKTITMGALPVLYAATYPGLEGGSYVGPDGIGEFRGHPQLVSPNRAARDEDVAARLWAVSEELTGVSFELGAGAGAAA